MATEEEVRLIFAAEDHFSDVADKVVTDLEKIGEAAEAVATEVADLSLPPITGFDDLYGRMDELQKETGELEEGFHDLGSQIDAEMSQGAGATTDFMSTLGSLKSVALGVATLWGAGKTIEEVLQFGEAGAGLINIEQGFNAAAEAAGYSGEEMLAQLMAVGQGIADDDFLMREFTITTRAAGPEIADTWSGLITVAMASAAQGIGDVEGNLQSLDMYIRTGFGRALKQMGIMVPDDSVIMDAYAASLGKTADQLTEAEQAQARLNAVLTTAERQFGDVDKAASELAGGGITRLRNAWGNFIEYLQTEAAPTIDDIADRLAHAIESGTPGTQANLEKVIQQVDLIRQATDYASQGVVGTPQEAIDDQLRGLVKQLELASLSEEQFAEVQGHVALQSQAVAEEMAAQRRESEAIIRQNALLAESATHTGLTLGDMAKRALSLGDAATSAADGVDDFVDSLLGANAVMPSVASGMHNLWRAMNPEAAPAGFEYSDTIQGRMGYMVDRYEWAENLRTEAEQRVADAAEESADRASQAWETYSADVASYVSSWESAAQGLLAPTGTLNVEDMLAATGQRKDKWDEAATRAEAVFQDYGNTAREAWFAGWAEQVGFPVGATNDQARAWAAQYTSEFYQNLHPEDVNYEALTGGMQGIINTKLGEQDIMAQLEPQLALAGLGPDNPAVMEAFDFAGMGTAGAADFGTQFRADLESQDWAAAGTGMVQSIAIGARRANTTLLSGLAGDLWPYIRGLMKGEENQ